MHKGKKEGSASTQKDLSEVILKVTKEIVVKFIEIGKVSPASFDETFRSVYKTVSSVTSND